MFVETDYTEILRNNGFETEVVHTILERLTMLVGARIGMIWAKKPPPIQVRGR
jgi:hypothetical protein